MRLLVLFVIACFPLHAFSDVKAGEKKAELCILCHKEAPDKRFVPLLDAQPANYLFAATLAFMSGQRKTSEAAMTVNLKNLSQADIRDIADYFASRRSPITARNTSFINWKPSVMVVEVILRECRCSTSVPI